MTFYYDIANLYILYYKKIKLDQNDQDTLLCTHENYHFRSRKCQFPKAVTSVAIRLILGTTAGVLNSNNEGCLPSVKDLPEEGLKVASPE
jgi:hypothetical protein